MFSALLARLRPPMVRTAPELRDFLAGRAALVTQKTMIGYCHARTMLPMSELMRDQGFREAFDQARRAGYAAVLEDLFVIAEGRLRGSDSLPLQDLAGGLVNLFVRMLEGGDAAVRPLEEPTVLGEQLRQRLAFVQAAPPKPIAEIAWVSAGRIYAAMPIHERLRAPDEEAIRASVRFMLVGTASAFDTRLDPPAIAADLGRAA